MLVRGLAFAGLVLAMAIAWRSSAEDPEPPVALAPSEQLASFRSDDRAALVLATVNRVHPVYKWYSAKERAREEIEIEIESVAWSGARFGRAKDLVTGGVLDVVNELRRKDGGSIAPGTVFPEHRFWIVLQGGDASSAPHVIAADLPPQTSFDPAVFLARYRSRENRVLVRATIDDAKAGAMFPSGVLEKLTVTIESVRWNDVTEGRLADLKAGVRLECVIVEERGVDCSKIEMLEPGREYWLVLQKNFVTQPSIVLAGIDASPDRSASAGGLFERFRKAPGSALVRATIRGISSERYDKDAPTRVEGERIETTIREVAWRSDAHPPDFADRDDAALVITNAPDPGDCERPARGSLRIGRTYWFALRTVATAPELRIVSAIEAP